MSGPRVSGGDNINEIQCSVVSSSFNDVILTYRQRPNHPSPRFLGIRNNRHPSQIPSPSPRDEKEVILSTRVALGWVMIIFFSSILTIGYVYSKFPKLSEDELQHIKIPFDIEDAKQLGLVLDKYKDSHFYEVLFGVFIIYIFLQSFAIPGSLFLSILSGFLFPFPVAISLVCTCSAVGASLCFLLSHLAGKRLIKTYFPERAKKWAFTVERNRDNLLFYMIFLRVTPILPNWFINLTAPIIGVPLIPFAVGTFLGVAPPSFVAIQAGQTLHTLTSSADAFSWTSVVLLVIFAFISLVPVFLKNKLKDKFE